MLRVNSNTDSHGNPNSNAHCDGNSYGHCNSYCNTYRDADSDSNCNTYCDGHAYSDSDTWPGSHNQSGNERRKCFRYTQWLSQSAWVDHDCLFPVGHDNQLRAHHPCADPDWEYVPAYHCQHQRLECEPPLSFPNCGHQRRRYQLWRRQDLYHPEPASRSHKQSGDERRKCFCYTQWLSQSAWVDHDCLFPVGHDNQLRAHHPCADPDWEYVPAYHCQHQRLECEPPLSFPNCSNQRWRHQLWPRQDLYHP